MNYKIDNRQTNDQKLIDIMFEIGLVIHTNDFLKKQNREQIATWIANQLKECGFPTTPIGSSWGVLQNKSFNLNPKEDE